MFSPIKIFRVKIDVSEAVHLGGDPFFIVAIVVGFLSFSSLAWKEFWRGHFENRKRKSESSKESPAVVYIQSKKAF